MITIYMDISSHFGGYLLIQKNVLCPMPSAPQVFPILISTVGQGNHGNQQGDRAAQEGRAREHAGVLFYQFPK